MRDGILFILLILIFFVGIITSIVFAFYGFIPGVQRLCIVAVIIGVTSWITANTLE